MSRQRTTTATTVGSNAIDGGMSRTPGSRGGNAAGEDESSGLAWWLRGCHHRYTFRLGIMLSVGIGVRTREGPAAIAGVLASPCQRHDSRPSDENIYFEALGTILMARA